MDKTKSDNVKPVSLQRCTSGATAWWAVSVAAGLLIVFFTVPWQPAQETPAGAPDFSWLLAPINSFDFSWMLVLHDAAATGAQFGKQIILPQGPLGFLGNDVFDPRTHWLVIIIRTVIAVVVAVAMCTAARALLPHPLLALPWLLALTALMGRSPDHFYPTCALLFIFTYFVVNDRRLSGTLFALAVVLGVSSLIKVNQPFYAAVAGATVLFDQAWRRDRWFFALPLTYLASVVLLYFAARQSPSSIGPFLWGWFVVTAGHTDAVGLPGPPIDVVAYLLVAALVVTLVGVMGWKQCRVAGALPAVLPAAGTAGVLLLLYKHSFMRQDAWHVHMGPMVTMAAAILYLPALWPRAGARLRAAGVAVVVLAGVVLTSILSSYTGENLLAYSTAVVQRCAHNVVAAGRMITDPGHRERERQAAMRQLRQLHPLPTDKIDGTVDIYPYRQDILFAYGLAYHPRPAISSLVATSPVLAELDAKHLRSTSAPETVLFDLTPVDQNHPTMLDGQSLPELLTGYDVADASGSLLVLRRSPSPRTYRFTPVLTRTARFEEPVAIPDADAPLWARIRFKTRAGGQLLSMLYKQPTLGIEVHQRNGHSTSYRLLPGLAGEQGFLLSPLIEDRAAYARLASPTWTSELRGAGVTSITLFVADGFGSLTYEPEFDVVLERLEFERQRGDSASPGALAPQ